MREEFEEMEQSEREKLENAMCDLQDALVELTEDEENDVTGGAVRRKTIRKTVKDKAWSYFYRIPYTYIPGKIVSYERISKDITVEAKGGTLWVERGSRRGKKQLKITSNKWYDTYITTYTIDFQ